MSVCLGTPSYPCAYKSSLLLQRIQSYLKVTQNRIKRKTIIIIFRIPIFFPVMCTIPWYMEVASGSSVLNSKPLSWAFYNFLWFLFTFCFLESDRRKNYCLVKCLAWCCLCSLFFGRTADAFTMYSMSSESSPSGWVDLDDLSYNTYWEHIALIGFLRVVNTYMQLSFSSK